MAKQFERLGVMIDMSRNAVMTVDSLEQFILILKKMGYNSLMLYTEDTYEIEGHPYFGYMRGRYSIEDMKRIQAYCDKIGIEVIPCIQVLAHLNQIFKWEKYPHDCNDVLLVDDERTYALIDDMFKTLRKIFHSDYIHVGMDEAHWLGRGAHLDKYGYEKTYDIILRHLNKVIEIAKKHNYTPVMWSDMFFRTWNGGYTGTWTNGKYQHFDSEITIPDDIKKAFPENVVPVYWDYYGTKKSQYDCMIKAHKQLSKDTWFAGGAWGWHGLIPFNAHSLTNSFPALDACKENKVKNVFITLWGNDGCESSNFALMPALLQIAEYAKNKNYNEVDTKAKFKRIVGIDYDDFMKIDLPNTTLVATRVPPNPSKYMLYSDYFNDFMDTLVEAGMAKKYGEFKVELKDVSKKSRKYGYLFDTASRLCEVLEIKYDLGLRTRRAYEAGDKATLKALAEYDYPEVQKRLQKFALAFEKQWMRENHPSGFDVQHHRLGGMIMRTDSCRRRILDYVSGKIPSILEYEEPLLDFKGNTPVTIESFNMYSTPNVISH